MVGIPFFVADSRLIRTTCCMAAPAEWVRDKAYQGWEMKDRKPK